MVFGAIGLILFGIDLYASGTSIHAAYSASILSQNYYAFMGNFSAWHLLGDILLIGIFGGFYIVPLYAFLQSHAEKSHQSQVIAANNIMNALFMVVSAGFSLWIFNLGFNIPQLFLVTALLSAMVTIYLCIRQPKYLKHFLAWIIR